MCEAKHVLARGSVLKEDRNIIDAFASKQTFLPACVLFGNEMKKSTRRFSGQVIESSLFLSGFVWLMIRQTKQEITFDDSMLSSMFRFCFFVLPS